MTEDESTNKNDTAALLFMRAAELTREPLASSDAETTKNIDNKE